VNFRDQFSSRHSHLSIDWGGTGVGLGNYASSLQQNLVVQAFPSGSLPWGGQQTDINSFILDLNGILFAVQLVVLLLIGPIADYGSFRPWILIVWTVIGIICSFAFLGFIDPSTWNLAAGFFVAGNLALNVTGAFYQAAFPGLVRDMPKLIESEQEVLAGRKDPQEHVKLSMLERSKLSNISFIISSAGSFIGILISVGISYGVGQATTYENTKSYAVIIGFFGALWVVTSIPWFIAEQHRPGQKLPDNTGWLTVGPKQVWEAARNAAKLKQTFIYLIAYFLINDAYNTSGTIVNILQNEAIDFSAVEYSWIFCLVYSLSAIFLFVSMWIQQRLGIPAKWMYFFNSCGVVFVNLWGVIGIWTNRIGYHNVWEFWFYQAFLGVFTSGLQSYSQTLMAEVTPEPKMFIFFALYNTLGKTAAFVGPFITSAIINDTNGNNNEAFWFTLVTNLVGLVILAFLDTNKAKKDNAAYLEKEREDLYASYGDRRVPEK
jgi:MFS-type transporter involved in bile tolerance (Atg22 family)